MGDVRELLATRARADAALREARKRQAKRRIPVGAVMFVVCGGPFALFCWWASWAPAPPGGHLSYPTHRMIRLLLIVLLGLALAGLGLISTGLKQLRQVRQVERTMAKRRGA